MEADEPMTDGIADMPPDDVPTSAAEPVSGAEAPLPPPPPDAAPEPAPPLPDLAGLMRRPDGIAGRGDDDMYAMFDAAPEWLKKIFKYSPEGLQDYYRSSSPEMREDIRRQTLGGMESARKLVLTVPGQELSAEAIAAKTGMSPGMVRYFQSNEPEYLKTRIANGEILEHSGIGGYVTAAMQNPKSAEELRYDAVLAAQIEADYLGSYETSSLVRIANDLKIGVGQVGVFGTRALRGTAQTIVDLADFANKDGDVDLSLGLGIVNWHKNPARRLGDGIIEPMRGYWNVAVKDAEAKWLAPPVDTGNPATDWLRTSVFRGIPFLVGSVALAKVMTPAVAAGAPAALGAQAVRTGARRAAAVLAYGMGSEAYGAVREAGGSPLAAAAAAAGSYLTSFYPNTFVLDRWSGILSGTRSPLKLFSLGAGLEMAEEYGAEFAEAWGQGLSIATANLLSAPGYDRDRWWKDAKESFWQAQEEGAAAAVLSGAIRIPGLPGAARSQARAQLSHRKFLSIADKLGQMELYKKGQDQTLVGVLNGTAKHRGEAGVMFASITDLEQGGLPKKRLLEGLGVSEAEYDYARDNNVDLVIPFGNAAVFAKRQADAGNSLFQDVIRSEPDTITGREIREREREMSATLQQADENFKAMRDPDDGKIPLRIKIFRAGLMAANHDVNVADAVSSVFWARAQRSAELWDMSPEQWLETRDVQLEMEGVVKDARALARYEELTLASRARHAAAAGRGEAEQAARDAARDIAAEPRPDAPAGASDEWGLADSMALIEGRLDAITEAELTEFIEVTGLTAEKIVELRESGLVSPKAERAFLDALARESGQAAPGSEADIGAGVSDLAQDVVGEADDQAWVRETTENIANALGIGDERYAPLVEEIRKTMEAGNNDPDVGALAEKLGMELPIPTVEVVDVDPAALVDDAGGPVNLKDRRALQKWIRERFQGREVAIDDDGTIQVFTGKRLAASLKRRGTAQRQMYAGLDELLRKSVYDGYVVGDEGHPKIERQNIYYAAAKIGDDYYGIRFKVDVPRTGRPAYKDHKVVEIISDVEIETAPSLYRTQSPEGGRTQNKGAAVEIDATPSLYRTQSPEGGHTQNKDAAIRNISLPVVKELVKPSRMILDSLYQENDGNKRGRILFPDFFQEKYGGSSENIGDAPTVIRIFRNADPSTVIHELNHLFVRDLQEMVAAGRGGERARADLAALTEFADGKLDRAGHEKIAQAWERYAMEGRAPSPELLDAFDVFRTYLGRVYGDAARQQGVEASAAVRSVFDRFLATDARIAEAERVYDQSGKWYEIALKNEEAKKRLRAADARARAARRGDMDAREGGGRALRRLGDGNLEEIRARIRGEEANAPPYRAVERAKLLGGLNRAEVERLTSSSLAADIAQRHGENVFGDGAELADVADMAGYQTIEEMLANLAGSPSIEQAVESRLEGELGAMGEADASPDDANGPSAGENELDAEEESLAAQVEEAVRESAGARGLREWRLKYLSMRTAAERLLGDMNMREAVDVRRFQKAKRDANRDARRAAEKGDKAKVAESLELELMHHLTVREGMRAREMRERVEKRYGTRALLSTLEGGEHAARVENAYAEAIKAVATFMGFTRSRRLRPQNDGATIPFPTYEAGSNVASFLPDTVGSVEPWLLNKVSPEGHQDWRDFTYNQIKEADRVLTALIAQGRGELHALRDAEARTLDELVEKSIQPMERRESRPGQDADDRTWLGRVLNKANRYLTSLTVPEYWFMMMDGNPTTRGEEAGVNQRLFWKMRDAQIAKDQLYKGLMERLTPHLTVLEDAKASLEERFGGRLFQVDGLEFPDILKNGRNYAAWDADLLLSMALMMGNDASLYRLSGIRRGQSEADVRADCYNFTEKDLAVVAGLFTADHWRAIQGVWDGLDSLYPQIDEVTFRITNRHVVKEPAMPLTVVTADGEALALKGGYFPLVNDPLLNVRSDQFRESSNIEDAIHSGLMDNVHQSTRPTDGMIKERLRDENGDPVVRLPQMLTTRILAKHLDTSTHYITHAESILEFDRLTRNSEWRSVFVDKFGNERYKAIRNWIQDLARPNRLNNEPGQQILERLRTLATINALGLRPTTAGKQQLGMFQAASFMTDASRTKISGWKYLKKGLRELGWGALIGRKTEKMRWVDSLSRFMTARSGAHNREINAVIQRIGPLDQNIRIPFTSRKIDKVKLHDGMFAMIQASDRVAAYATWIGAYEQAMAGDANFDIMGMSDAKRHEEAVRFADSAAATQASSFLADLTEAQRSTGIMRFVSMFMSGNIRQGSRLMQYIDAYRLGDKTKGDVVWLAFREFVAPAMAWVLAASMIKAALGGDDDDLLSEAAWEVVETSLAPFPVVREIPSIARYGSEGNVPALSSPAKALTKGFRAFKRAAQGRYIDAAADAGDAAGFWLGVPFMNLVRQAKPLTDAAGISERRPRERR